MTVGVLSTQTKAGRRTAKRMADAIDPRTPLEEQLRSLLSDLAAGESFIVVSADAEVTPAEAATMLGVTRQYVDRLIVDGVLECRGLPGSRHRRLRAADVAGVREERDRMRAGRRELASLLGED